MSCVLYYRSTFVTVNVNVTVPVTVVMCNV